MLHELLEEHGTEILRRARALTTQRALQSGAMAANGAPVILRVVDDLVAVLHAGPRGAHARNVDADEALQHSEAAAVARTIRAYRDVCRVAAQVVDGDTRGHAREFGTLEDSLDEAVARAAARIVEGETRRCRDEEVQRLGALAHELRNHLQTASLSFLAIERASAETGTGALAALGRSLAGLKLLVDRALTRVRLSTNVLDRTPIDVAVFLKEVEAASIPLAAESGVHLVVHPGDHDVTVDGDRPSLWSAVFNILKNALDFTQEKGHVWLRTTASHDRVAIVVTDQCGGWQSVEAKKRASHRHCAGLGIGLTISRRAVESMGGTIRVRDEPGVGCVVTVELPRTPSGGEPTVAGPASPVPTGART